jgi:hypothetical protein
VASRDEVYLRAGRGLQLSQLLETELGTALLALDALATRSHLNPNPDKYARLRGAIAKQTLGKSLAQMREKLKMQEDVEAVLANALEARNELAHRFFPRHGLKMTEDDGRDEMLMDLERVIATLEQGYAFAGNVASALVRAVQQEVDNAA